MASDTSTSYQFVFWKGRKYIMTTISDIKTTIKSVALTHPFVTALHEVDKIQAVKTTIILSNGDVGVGTATPNEKVTGDNLNILRETIEQVIKPQLVGLQFTPFNRLLSIVNNSIVNQTPAKTSVELALQNLRSKELHCSLVDLLGGSPGSVETDYTISIGDEQKMISEAKNLVKQGFTSLKVKLGDASFDKDVDTILKIANVVGPNISIRIDCNQAWNRKQTLRADNIWYKNGLNIDFIEQPVLKNAIDDMQFVTTYCNYPIMADESVASYYDAYNLISHHACDYINIKLMKTGGLNEAVKIDNLAQVNGMRTMIGCMIEPIESIAAGVAFALAHPNVKFVDLDSIFMATKDPELDKYVTLNKNTINLI